MTLKYLIYCQMGIFATETSQNMLQNFITGQKEDEPLNDS